MARMLTLLNIPEELEIILKTKARAQGKSINEVAMETLAAANGVTLNGNKERDLSAIVGTWVDDPVYDEIREFHEQIDPDLWK